MPPRRHNLKALKDRFEKTMNRWYPNTNRRLVLGVAMFIWCWALVYCFVGYHSKYTSQSLLLIKDSAISDRYVLPDQYYALQNTTSSSANPVLNTMGLLKSETISQALFKYLQNDHPEELKRMKIRTQAQWDAYFNNGKNNIKAKNEPGTDFISIEFTWSNPTIAKEGLDTVLKAFQAASLDLNQAEQRSRSRYLENQVQVIADQLESVRSKKRLYKSKMGTVDISPESNSLVQSQTETASKLSELLASANGKEAEFKRYQKVLGMSSEAALEASAVGLNGSLAKLQDDYYKQSQDYAFLKATLTDKNPKVQEAKAQLEQTEENIKAETIRTLGKSKKLEGSTAIADATRGAVIAQMVEAQAEATRLNAEAEVTSKHLSSIAEQIEVFPTVEEDLTNIEEKEKSLSNALFTLRQKKLEAEMKQAETLSNVFIVDAPLLPTHEQFPRQLHIVIIGFIMGAVAGIMAGLFEEKLRNVIGDELQADLEAEEKRHRLWAQVARNHSSPNAASPGPSSDTNIYLDFLYPETQERSPVSRAHTNPTDTLNHRLKARIYKALLSSSGTKDRAVRRTKSNYIAADYAWAKKSDERADASIPQSRLQ